MYLPLFIYTLYKGFYFLTLKSNPNFRCNSISVTHIQIDNIREPGDNHHEPEDNLKGPVTIFRFLPSFASIGISWSDGRMIGAHLNLHFQLFTLLDIYHTIGTIGRDYSRWILRQKTRAGAATRVSQGLPRHYGGLPVGVKWCHTNLDGSFNKYVKEIRGSSARKLWCT